MKMPRREGILRITQLVGNKQNQNVFIRDLDATEWSYEWAKRGGVDILRVTHDNTNDYTDTFEFIEFSAPVQIEFIAQH